MLTKRCRSFVIARTELCPVVTVEGEVSKRPIAGAPESVPAVKAALSTKDAPDPEQFAQVMESWPLAFTAAF
jgi:hypothetical protein